MTDIRTIDNTLKYRPLFNTPQEQQIRSAPMSSTYRANQGTIVSFEVDVMEMFGVNLDYPGIRQAINAAWMESRHYVPVDTGLLRKSYSTRILSDTMVEMYFDPLKIVGMIRKHREVEDYYPQWVGSSGPDNRAWNWLTIVMSHFYDTLIAEVRKLERKPAYKERQAQGRSTPSPTRSLVALVENLDAERKGILAERELQRREKAQRMREEAERRKKIRALVRQRREDRK